MAEKITLNTPVYTQPGISDFRVVSLNLRRGVGNILAEIHVRLLETSGSSLVENGKTITAVYTGSVAETLLNALNKADLTVKSLERRVIERLLADGKIGTGTISGTPD